MSETVLEVLCYRYLKLSEHVFFTVDIAHIKGILDQVPSQKECSPFLQQYHQSNPELFIELSNGEIWALGDSVGFVTLQANQSQRIPPILQSWTNDLSIKQLYMIDRNLYILLDPLQPRSHT